MSAPPRKPSPAPSVACLGSNHRPSRSQTGTGTGTTPSLDGVRRTRCRCCGLQVMRTAISRRWIIADQLG